LIRRFRLGARDALELELRSAFLGAFAIADVAQRDEMRRLARPLRIDDADLRGGRRRGRSNDLDLRFVRRHDGKAKVAPRQLRRRPAKLLFGGGIGELDDAVVVHDQHTVGDSIDDRLESLLLETIAPAPIPSGFRLGAHARCNVKLHARFGSRLHA
jgi:hypothetical protein